MTNFIMKEADITLAVNSIIHSKTFDNGMICASEQSVIVLDKVYKKVKRNLPNAAVIFLTVKKPKEYAKPLL
ncbi:MAG: aldehyde dehydrogenase family protein [Oscillospiraceae bacterium]